jgi:hypothetical protein
MRKPGISFVLGLVAVVSAVETPAQSAVPVTLIKAGRLLDPRTGNVLSPAAVLIANGKIKEVGALARVQPNVPAGAKTIDLGSATLLPGLIDSHTHLLMDNIVYVAEAERARQLGSDERIERLQDIHDSVRRRALRLGCGAEWSDFQVRRRCTGRDGDSDEGIIHHGRHGELLVMCTGGAAGSGAVGLRIAGALRNEGRNDALRHNGAFELNDVKGALQ